MKGTLFKDFYLLVIFMIFLIGEQIERALGSERPSFFARLELAGGQSRTTRRYLIRLQAIKDRWRMSNDSNQTPEVPVDQTTDFS